MSSLLTDLENEFEIDSKLKSYKNIEEKIGNSKVINKFANKNSNLFLSDFV